MEFLLKRSSGGDTSFACLLWQEGLRWMSYDSSHRGQTSFSLARVKFEGTLVAV